MDNTIASSVPRVLQAGDVLLIIDVQNDFLEGGALAVPDGNAVIPVLNRYIALFSQQGLPILATRDWHPEQHGSFHQHGGPWPRHCVAGSAGAAFADTLQLPRSTHVISKGTDPDKAGYSAFESFQLLRLLARLHSRRLFVGGLATDYCVLHTVLAARRRGFEVVVLRDAIRAVEARRGDEAAALTRMRRAGAGFITTSCLHATDEDHAHGASESVAYRPVPARNAEELPRRGHG